MTEKSKLRLGYNIYARVLSIEEKFRKEWIEGIGRDAKFAEIPLGWFIHFEGSFESLFFGMSEPDFEVGEMVKISFSHAE